MPAAALLLEVFGPGWLFVYLPAMMGHPPLCFAILQVYLGNWHGTQVAVKQVLSSDLELPTQEARMRALTMSSPVFEGLKKVRRCCIRAGLGQHSAYLANKKQMQTGNSRAVHAIASFKYLFRT